MSHSFDGNGNPSGSPPGQPSMSTLAKAPNGDVHLLATFDFLAGDQRTDGGGSDVSAPTFTMASVDGELADDRESPEDSDAQAEPDASDGPDAPTDSGGAANWDPFVDSVTDRGASDTEYIDQEFDEAADVESLVSYLGLDFVEHELFAERFLSESDDVVYTCRGVGSYQLLCVYSAVCGVLLVVDEDEAIRPLVGHARSLLTET